MATDPNASISQLAPVNTDPNASVSQLAPANRPNTDDTAGARTANLHEKEHSQHSRAYSHTQQSGHDSEDYSIYDPEREGPYADNTSSESEIEEVFEHVHSADQVEFQLIPHHQDKDKWKIYLPIAFWFPKYKWREWLPYDLIAAVTAVVMVIPQGMGYALVAGLEPIYGLYSALMGHCLYGPFGTSGQLIVAPVAIVSLMTKETLHGFGHIAEDDPVKYSAYGSCLAFQVGIISLVLGICRAGVLANMLAEPVIVGFTFAAAILIGVSQMTFIFQIEIEGESLIFKLINFFNHVSSSHGASILLAICCIIFLLIHRFWTKSSLKSGKYAKFIPIALILVIITTSISANMNNDTQWDVVGPLPNGLPKFRNFFQYVDSSDFWSLWMPSLLISILAFIESIAVATKFADKHDYSIDASQELIALGICNLIGCWFQIYPVSGVLSLATVVEAAGALTPLYSIIAGCGMIICTSFLLFLFEWLPKPVLGSIVLVGIINLIDIHKMREIWKINRRDFSVMIITILVTLVLGIDYGVALGVVVSIILFIQRAAKPHYGVLGKLTDKDADQTQQTGNVYRNVKHFPDAEIRDNLLIIRWDASIFFANVESFKHRIRKHIGRHLSSHNYPKYWCLVLCFSGVNHIDYTGFEALKAFFIELNEKEKGMQLVLCKLKTQVLNILKKGEIVPDIIPISHVLWELHEAEHWWDQQLKTIQLLQKKRSSLKIKKKKKIKKKINSKDTNNLEMLIEKQKSLEILLDTGAQTQHIHLMKQHSEIALDDINDDDDKMLTTNVITPVASKSNLQHFPNYNDDDHHEYDQKPQLINTKDTDDDHDVYDGD